jgi:hypothetical protein
MKKNSAFVLIGLLFAGLALAQSPGNNVPSVVMAPIGKVQVQAGASTDVSLDFRIGSEFHINSHTPKSELLIPTVLKLQAPDQVMVADVKYPAGQDVSFPFSPDEKLSVYSGDFTIDTVLKAPSNAAAGTYPVTGTLRFQACDHSACYPPKSIPVQFQVTVVKK